MEQGKGRSAIKLELPYALKAEFLKLMGIYLFLKNEKYIYVPGDNVNL